MGFDSAVFLDTQNDKLRSNNWQANQSNQYSKLINLINVLSSERHKGACSLWLCWTHTKHLDLQEASGFLYWSQCCD